MVSLQHVFHVIACERGNPLHEFDTILEDVVICLTSQKQTEMLQAAYRRVSGQINNMDKVCVKQVTTEFPKEDADAESPNKREDS